MGGAAASPLVHPSAAEEGGEPSWVDYEPGKVDGAAFAVVFKHLGRLEREARARHRRRAARRAHRAAEAAEAAASRRGSLASVCSSAGGSVAASRRGTALHGEEDPPGPAAGLRYTEGERVAAERKMRDAAHRFNRREHGGDVHAIQDGPAMTPRVFRKVMNKTFHMGLSRGEGDALFGIFDADGGGDVDGAEFLSKFFRYNKEEHEREIREEKEAASRRASEAHLARERADRDHRRQLAAELSSFTRRDVASAAQKIRAAAAGYDRTKGGSLESFKGGVDMGPEDFREELKGTFDLKATWPELGLLFYMFDDDGGGTIERAEFLGLFFKLRRDDPDTVEALEILVALTEEELEPIRQAIRDCFMPTDAPAGEEEEEEAFPLVPVPAAAAEGGGAQQKRRSIAGVRRRSSTKVVLPLQVTTSDLPPGVKIGAITPVGQALPHKEVDGEKNIQQQQASIVTAAGRKLGTAGAPVIDHAMDGKGSSSGSSSFPFSPIEIVQKQLEAPPSSAAFENQKLSIVIPPGGSTSSKPRKHSNSSGGDSSRSGGGTIATLKLPKL